MRDNLGLMRHGAAAVWCSVLQCGAVCCSVLQCVTVCCSVLQCVAMIAVRSLCVAAVGRVYDLLQYLSFLLLSFLFPCVSFFLGFRRHNLITGLSGRRAPYNHLGPKNCPGL